MLAERSVVPAKAQIPVAVGLAVVFVFLLFLRFNAKSDSASADREAEAIGTNYQAELADLQLLVANLQALGQLVVVKPKRSLPSIHIDPFLSARSSDGGMEDKHGPLLEGHSSNANPENRTDEEGMLESRSNRFMALELEAVALSEDERIALVSDRVLEVGQQVNGFTVDEIEENAVVLNDEHGTMVLYLPEAPGL